jgi:hypothetical protein
VSLAADVYHELSIVGLATAVPFVAADSKWREAILSAVGESDDLKEELREAELRIERIEESREGLREEVRSLTADLKSMTKERDRLANIVMKESVSP